MNHVRHSGIYNFPPGFSITLIGAGGIGAITAIMLAKMGCPSLTIIDDDTVEDVNLPGQLHKLSDIGKPKAEALADTIKMFADDTYLKAFQERVTKETKLSRKNIVISAVDSITARKEIWTQVNCDYYIDARMAAEQYQHFAVDMMSPTSIVNYEDGLYRLNEDDVEELPCTAKATMYTGAMAAGHVGAVVRNILVGKFASHRLIHYIPQESLLGAWENNTQSILTFKL